MSRDPILSVPAEAAAMYDRLRAHQGSPADKVLVFAPNRAAAEDWARENEFNRHEVTYVTNYVQLRNLCTKGFPRVFVHGWRLHPQFRSIAAELTRRDKAVPAKGWRP